MRRGGSKEVQPQWPKDAQRGVQSRRILYWIPGGSLDPYWRRPRPSIGGHAAARREDVPQTDYFGVAGRPFLAVHTGSSPRSTSTGAFRRCVAFSHAAAMPTSDPSCQGRAENSIPNGNPLS